MAATDMLVLPYARGASMRHGGLLACLAQGRPVITTESPWDMPGFKPDETFLMVPVGDAAALVQAITAVATNPSLRNRLTTGANSARQVFSWDRIAGKHRELYESFSGSACRVQPTAAISRARDQSGLQCHQL
jgi:glycosyltransferase involved in cell wall biosynthesis